METEKYICIKKKTNMEITKYLEMNDKKKPHIMKLVNPTKITVTGGFIALNTYYKTRKNLSVEFKR